MNLFNTTSNQLESISNYVDKLSNGGYHECTFDYFMTKDKGFEGVVVVRSIVGYVEESYVRKEDYICFKPDGTISDCDDLMYDLGVKLTFYRNLIELEPCNTGFCIKE